MSTNVKNTGITWEKRAAYLVVSKDHAYTLRRHRRAGQPAYWSVYDQNQTLIRRKVGSLAAAKAWAQAHRAEGKGKGLVSRWAATKAWAQAQRAKGKGKPQAPEVAPPKARTVAEVIASLTAEVEATERALAAKRDELEVFLRHAA